MQNRYAGDVGDFGKYGLLRALVGYPSPDLRLAVVWYLVTTEESHARVHDTYLEQKNAGRYRPCDPTLYDILRMVVRGGRRVVAIEQSGVFPRDAAFFRDPVPLTTAETLGQAPARREQWLGAALAATDRCDLVFLDPDNGIATGTRSPGPKHASLNELRQFVARDQSLVVYHHLARRPHGAQTGEVVASLQREFESAVFGIRWRRGTGRLFVIVPARRHLSILHDRARDFVAGPWGVNRHAEFVQPSSSAADPSL
jgi:hypothetical protein